VSALQPRSRIAAVCSLLRWASRLGDGVFWYGLMLGLLVVDGQDGAAPVAKMILAGGTGTLVYKMLKRRLLRPRPYQVNQAISLGVAPLDQFSFPSGHTLHAGGVYASGACLLSAALLAVGPVHVFGGCLASCAGGALSKRRAGRRGDWRADRRAGSQLSSPEQLTPEVAKHAGQGDEATMMDR